MKNELISVIIPVYKVEKYLDRCVNSIVRQSYSKLEIILVNDGSPDKCPQMCDKWEKKDNRIKVIHKENGGLSDARNIGLKAAQGTYICFIDSDDYVSEKFVEILYRLICTKHTDISAVALKKVFLENRNEDEEMEYRQSEIVFEGESAVKELFSEATYGNYAWNKMYKRDLFDEIQFPIGKKMEDLGTTYKLLFAAGRIAYSPQIHYFYFQRDDSILHKPNFDFYKDKFELSRERYEAIKNAYPNMKENDYFFFWVLLKNYPRLYKEFKDYDWKNMARYTFENCKEMMSSKDKIKLLWLVNCGVIYRCINKFKR